MSSDYEHDEQGAPPVALEQVDRSDQITAAFGICEGRDSERFLTAFDRIAISLIAIDFLQSGNAADFREHAKSMGSEVRNAFVARAGEIFEASVKDAQKTEDQNLKESIWFRAVDAGIQRTLKDFLSASNANHENLSNLVRSQLSVKAQLATAIIVTIAVSIFFAVVKKLNI